MHASEVNSDHATELQKLQAELCDAKAQLSDLLEQRSRDESYRQQLVAIVEASRDAIWSWTPDCIITSWNAEAERLFQYRPDEIIGKSLLTLVPPERMDRARLAIDRLQKGGWYDQYETVRLRKDGVRVPVELTVSPINDADGTVLGVTTACRDITVRQHYEEALRESEERFSKVFKLAPIAMSISTLDEGRYLDVNEALLAVTGYSREEVVGHTARDLKVFADPEDAIRIRKLLAGGELLRGLELRLRGKDGDVRTSLLAADIIDLKDKPCLLTASVDITDRKEREATLQFLDALGKETAKIADADSILDVTTRMLGEHLGVAVCAYADMDADEDGFTIRGNWSAPGSMSIVGHYSLAAFGKLAVKNLHAGLPLILHDNRAQLPADEAATFLSIGLAATICMPLVKEGRLTALMAIHDRVPRAWTSKELSTLTEVTERSWAHIERVRLIQDLRNSETRYRGAVITGRIAAWETDMVTRTRIWTDEGMELFGLNLPGGRGQVGGENDEFLGALHPDDKHMMAQFHRTADQEDSYPVEYRIVRPDGAMLWVSGRGRVVARGADGKAHRVFNIVMDISERKKAEEHVQLLMREVSHRSKNLLAVVQSIAGQTVRTAGSLEKFAAMFTHRLQGLAASHDLLIQENWRGALLHDLAVHQLALFAEAGGPRLTITGPKIMLTPQAAQAIGLALHELGTNAIKHGAWSVPSGNVSIRWTFDAHSNGASVLQMRWEERGGPLVAEPVRKGFGHVVIGSMVGQATGGEVCVDFAPPGLTWTLSIPASSLVIS
jgi:PAS domain S-box-containing protein